jgi:hypothetical protein
MASIFTASTGFVTPEDKGGPRVGIGCRALVKRAGDGAVTMSVRRGDGGGPETYPDEIRSKQQAFRNEVEAEMTLGTMDLDLVDFTERGYQLVIEADGGADLSVRDHLIATEPHSVPG